MRWAGHLEGMGDGIGEYRVSVGRPKRKSPLERPKNCWEDNIKIEL